MQSPTYDQLDGCLRSAVARTTIAAENATQSVRMLDPLQQVHARVSLLVALASRCASGSSTRVLLFTNVTHFANRLSTSHDCSCEIDVETCA